MYISIDWTIAIAMILAGVAILIYASGKGSRILPYLRRTTRRTKTRLRLLRNWWRKKRMPKEPDQSPYRESIAAGEFIGMKINAFVWNVIVRPIASALGGLVIVLALLLLDQAIIGSYVLDSWTGAALVLLFALFIGAGDTPEEVPAAHAAMITFMGMRTRFYRTEGKYPWTGKNLLLGRYAVDRSEVSKSELVGTDEQGFINLGEIQIEIWNRADDKNQTQLELVTRDSASIKATILIVIQLLDPYAWTSSDNPLLDIAERARSAFRTAASFFTAVDNAAIKSVLGNLMSGKTVITSFLPKVVRSHAANSVIQNRGGVHLYEVLPADATPEAIAEGIADFKEKLLVEADEEMLKNVTGKDGNYAVEHRTVESAIEEVIEASGAKLIRASVGTISLPGEVTTEANKAASEARQRDAQIASANTFAETKKIMDDAKKPGDEIAAAIAAAKDNPNAVKVIFVPGADALTKAAVAAATQINTGGN